MRNSQRHDSLTFETKEVTQRTLLKIVALGFRITMCFKSKNFHARVMKNEIKSRYNYREQCKKGVEKWQAELKVINKIEIARVHHQIVPLS